MKRRAYLAGVILGVLAATFGLAAFVVAIWTVGPNSGRWFGTGFIAFVVGLFMAALCYIGWEES